MTTMMDDDVDAAPANGSKAGAQLTTHPALGPPQP